MTNYYNEIDPYAAQWLRNLIDAKLIPAGDVDERSISDVKAKDLKGYTQCHFFAGIGGWSYALQLAGWPTDLPVWTGSCPCHPFSLSGKKQGVKDERHLWPIWFNLISKCRPQVVFGEQVEAAIGHGWLDLVQSDLETAGYASAAVGLPAACIGAPHARHRLFFCSNAIRKGWKGYQQNNSLSLTKRQTPAQLGNPFALVWRTLDKDITGVLRSDGIPVAVERCATKGYGNAIVPQVAAEVIKSFMEVVK